MAWELQQSPEQAAAPAAAGSPAASAALENAAVDGANVSASHDKQQQLTPELGHSPAPGAVTVIEPIGAAVQESGDNAAVPSLPSTADPPTGCTPQQHTAAAAPDDDADLDFYLPAGFKLDVQLQMRRSIAWISQGMATLELQQLLGSGSLADAYLARVCHFKPTKSTQSAGVPATSSGSLPELLVIKLAHQRSRHATLDAEVFRQRAKQNLWDEQSILSKLDTCQGVIDSYGFGMARAQPVDGVCAEVNGFSQAVPCLLLEWAELGSLSQHLGMYEAEEASPMSADKARLIMCQLQYAAAAVQEWGYIHRDIKPENVLVCRKPGSSSLTYKLSDMGLAVSVAADIANDSTEGTPAYWPPEAYWQKCSDTWMLGKLLLACRSCQLPHPGTYEQIRASGAYEDHLPEPLTRAEWSFLEVCLTADCGRRPTPKHLFFRTPYLTP